MANATTEALSLTCPENLADLLYEVVGGQIVEKPAMGRFDRFSLPSCRV